MNEYVVDDSKFFTSMILELQNKETTDKHYTFKRIGEFLNFYSDDLEYNKVTILIDDNQFRDYFDELSQIFTGSFSEAVVYTDSDAELYALINNKLVNIKSDNLNDEWINKKIKGMGLVQKKKD